MAYEPNGASSMPPQATALRVAFLYPEAGEIHPPEVCPDSTCGGTEFRLHQQVTKPVRDTAREEVVAHRYQCLTCKRTFRVYPDGVSQAHTSYRIKEFSIFLYTLGLSYGAVSRLLEAAGTRMCRSWVYDVVQSMQKEKGDLDRATLFGGAKIQTTGASLALIKHEGGWYPVNLHVQGANRIQLTIKELTSLQLERIEQTVREKAAFMQADLTIERITVETNGVAPYPMTEQGGTRPTSDRGAMTYQREPFPLDKFKEPRRTDKDASSSWIR